jgi:Fe-Mn family superoxide dismutase
MSRETLAAHHHHHHSAYVERTRALIQGTPLESASLERVVAASARKKPRLFNAAAQAWNHQFFWEGMRPGGGGTAEGVIATCIRETYGSQSAFNQQFIIAALDHFGSGWVWLTLDQGALRILTTDNAGTPFVDGLTPLLVLDLWEHAYYLDYAHRRLDYVAGFLAHLVDWEAVNHRFVAAQEAVAGTICKIALPRISGA